MLSRQERKGSHWELVGGEKDPYGQEQNRDKTRTVANTETGAALGADGPTRIRVLPAWWPRAWMGRASGPRRLVERALRGQNFSERAG